MMAANYRHIGGLENRLGRHYSRFSASGPAAPLAAQSLARRKSRNGGSNRRSWAKTEPGRDFYPAEDYHQDFLTRNPSYSYIVVNDLPKIEALKRLFPDLYRPTPVLVAAAAPRN